MSRIGTTDRATTGRRAKWAVPVGVILIATLLIGAVIWMQSTNSTDTDDAPAPTETTTAPPGDTGDSDASDNSDTSDETGETQGQGEAHDLDFSWAERRDPNDLLAAGPVDAPIGLIVFSDYQCPFCAQWNAETLPAMMELAEQDQLRIEWRDSNIFGPASIRASHAAYAAALQGSYWQYHDALFAGGEKRPESELSEDALTALAADLGLDVQQFTTDMNSDTTAAAVKENVDLAMQLGAFSTPSFLFGGVPISGAQPTEAFLDIYEALLVERGGQ